MYKKIHFGPGPDFKDVKNSAEWTCLDIDPDRATAPEFAIDFNKNFKKLPFNNNECQAIYSSHTFEHISTAVTPILFKECYRILTSGGCIRIIIPDPVKSIKNYLKGNTNFPLFKHRSKRYKNYRPTLFELMREDFISLSGQQELLGANALAHQNAWDSETMFACLKRAGFTKVYQMEYKKSMVDFFNFEGTYSSEADEYDRSQYFEAIK